ncbi:MAG: hypothetical protein ABI781_16270 [Burkholderiales bacterium]
MSTTTTPVSTRPAAAGSKVLPQRKSPAPLLAPRLPFRVLQTSRSPAQLSLFLRPGLSSR